MEKKDNIYIWKDKNKKGKEILYLQIRPSEAGTYIKRIRNGKKPSLSIVDIDGDHKKEMLFSLPSNKKGVPANHHIFSITNKKLTELELPGPLTISSQFEQDYKASLIVEDTNQRFEFDLKNRKKKYEKLGLYDNGILHEPMELIIQPYARIYPTTLKGRISIVGEQTFEGAANGDQIGKMTSFWQFEEGKWELKKVKVKKIKDKKSKTRHK